MSTKTKQPKLTVELVPTTCHYSNARTMVSTKEWNTIRFISYEKANHKCEICKETGKEQGYGHNVECHEIWEYDDVNKIQTLKGLISLCPICHQVKHIGRAIAMGRQKIVFDQMAKVNKWSEEQIHQHIQESFELHKERSKYQWDLDISILAKEPYNIKLKNYKERIFEVKKIRKKRKRKKKAVAKKKVVKRATKKRPPKK